MRIRTALRAAGALTGLVPVLAHAAGPAEHSGAKLPLNVTAIAIFCGFVLLTLGITYWASKRSRTASDFLTAGGNITGFQNGLAIAGDAVSSATVLGLVSFIYARGFDGLVSSVGFFVGWPVLLLLMADRLRNLGRYTFADIISFRLDPKPTRCLAAVCGLTVVFFYLIIQIVGAGELVTLLFGLDYEVAVVAVGVLMVIYVTFGGMVATTWVQIIKATLLLFGLTLLGILVMSRFGFSLETLAVKAVASNRAGAVVMGPGSFLSSPIGALSVAIGSVCGISGLPHILMRFFTVPDARAARMSVFYASGILGYSFLLSAILGLAGMSLIATDPQFFEGGNLGGKLLGGANLVSLHLAQLTGGNLLFGFLAAVLFATILAVVSGLAISGAAAISHDLYANVFRSGRASGEDEVRVTKIATVGLGMVMIALGILFKGQNLTFLTVLAVGVAASANFPLLVLSMYWKGLTTRGALWGGWGGLISATALVILGPGVWTSVLGHQAPIFPYDGPAIVSMPLSFLLAYVMSVTDRSERARIERSRFAAQLVQAQTGFGTAASSHAAVREVAARTKAAIDV